MPSPTNTNFQSDLSFILENASIKRIKPFSLCKRPTEIIQFSFSQFNSLKFGAGFGTILILVRLPNNLTFLSFA